MTVAFWIFIVQFSLLYCQINGNHVTSSCTAIHIICQSNYQIVILNINISSSLAKNIQGHCSGHPECHVPTFEECVQAQYWCKIQNDVLEMGKSSSIQFKSKISSFGMMSLDYLNGQYQTANTIRCELKFTKKNIKTQRNLTVRLYEFTAFETTHQFCLYMKHSSQYCSGSNNNLTALGPFDGNDGWQFNLTLQDDVINTQKVRFWFDVKVNGGNNTWYTFSCNSKQATSGSPHATTLVTGFQKSTPIVHTKSAVTMTNIVLGSVLGFVTLLTVVLTISLFCLRQRYLNAEDDIYCDVVLPHDDVTPSTPLPPINTRNANTETNISLGMPIIEGFSYRAQSENSSQHSNPTYNMECENMMPALNNEISDDMEIIDNEYYCSQISRMRNPPNAAPDEMTITDNAYCGSAQDLGVETPDNGRATHPSVSTNDSALALNNENAIDSESFDHQNNAASNMDDTPQMLENAETPGYPCYEFCEVGSPRYELCEVGSPCYELCEVSSPEH